MTKRDWRDAARCKNPKCQFTLGRYERRPFCASCWAAGRWGAGAMFLVGAIAETVRIVWW